MKVLSIAAILLASITLALMPALSTIYREAFPDERTKGAALSACAEADPSFHRLIAEQRAQCYGQRLEAPQAPLPAPRTLEIATLGF
ncbi:MAG TPA: hypothetical protein VGR70_00905 [Stellaceae bacterium]|nr:hypothetical protein [Stellaceae bacterium]